MRRTPRRRNVPNPVGQTLSDRMPILGKGLSADSESTGLAFLMEEVQARFLGHSVESKWVPGDVISKVGQLSLTRLSYNRERTICSTWAGGA